MSMVLCIMLVLTQVLTCGAVRSAKIPSWKSTEFSDLGIVVNRTTSVTLRLKTCGHVELNLYTSSASHMVKIKGSTGVSICSRSCNKLKFDFCSTSGILTVKWEDQAPLSVAANCDWSTSKTGRGKMNALPSRITLTSLGEELEFEYGDDLCAPPTTTTTTIPTTTSTSAMEPTVTTPLFLEVTSPVAQPSPDPESMTLPPTVSPTPPGLDSGSRRSSGFSTMFIAGTQLLLVVTAIVL